MDADERDTDREPSADDATEEAGRLLESYAQAVEEGRLEDADETMAAFMESLAEWVETQPEHEVSPVDRGDAAFEAGDLVKAEQCYLEAVSAAQGAYDLHTPRSHLINLYGWQNRHAEAVEIARAQVESARETELDIYMAGTLETLGYCLTRAGDDAAAEAAFIEALEKYGLEAMSSTLRARVLVALAGVRDRRGDSAGAELDLETAWGLVSQQAGMAFSGADVVLASWWGVTARRREAAGDIEGTVEAWKEAVQARRRFGTGPLDPGVLVRAQRIRRLAEDLRNLGESLKEVGDTQGAVTAIVESDVLLASLKMPARGEAAG